METPNGGVTKYTYNADNDRLEKVTSHDSASGSAPEGLYINRKNLNILVRVILMKNKQHEYILKAFLESTIPAIIRKRSPELMAIDSIIGGYCARLVKRARFIEIPSNNIISKAEKAAFSELINQQEWKKMSW